MASHLWRRKLQRLRRWVVLSLLLLLPSAAMAADLRVLLVASDKSPHYQEYVHALRDKLPRNVIVSVLDQVPGESPVGAESDLVVAVGVKASEWAASDPGKPLLAVMIPSERFPELLARRAGKASISAIFIDQPPARQARILRELLPARKRVGVLHAPTASAGMDALRAGFAAKGAQVVEQVAVPERLSATLEQFLNGVDVLLAVPDSAIYNSSSIRNILMASYRRGVPLVGLSYAYVNAGALYALYSTPEQLAAQTATVLLQYEKTHRLPPARHPESYSIMVNREVARSLGIQMPGDAEIQQRTGREEGEQ